MITILITICMFSLGCIEGEKILEGKETLTKVLYLRARELIKGEL